MNSGKRTRVAQGTSNLNAIVSKLRKNLTNLGMNPGAINTKINELRSTTSRNKTAYATSIYNKAKAAKARSNAAKAAKAAKAMKTVRNTTKASNTTETNKALRGRIYQIYNSLRKTNRIDNKRIFNFLFSYYKDAHGTFLSRTFGGKSDDFIRSALIKQYDIMKNNDKSRNAGYVSRIKVEFDDTNLKDFVMMMYLDMYHDKTFTGTLTAFVKSGIPSELLGEKDPNKLSGHTKLKQTLINEGIFNLTDDKPVEDTNNPYERKLKNGLAPIFDLKDPYIFNQTVNLSNYAKDKRNPIYMSIDAESKQRPFSSLITQSKFTNGPATRKFVKSIISISNRVDPGNLMPTGGGAQEYNRLFNFTRNNSTRSTQLYDFCDYVITFHKQKITLASRLGEQTEPFYLTIDDVEYPLSASAKKGQKNTGTALKISKFLGDFLQIIVTAKSNKTFMATQDGMCSAMTVFIFKNVLKMRPRLFIEYAFPQGNKFAVYGAEDVLKRDPNQNRNVTNILTGHSSGGSTISLNNSNNNNAQSKRSNTNSINNTLKRKPNRNNNNSNQPPAKRQKIENTRIINNQKTANTTTRNNQKAQFIKNLNKLTNLSQRSKRGYIQNFNNGNNTNKLLREAKNENNKLKIAATSIRKGSLRKPNPEGRMTMFGFRE